jgi:large subunit ribosomal protein L10
MFAHYIGLTVSDVSELRSKLREKNAEMKVGKKTLMKIAAKELNLPEISDDMMEGPVACIFSFEDPVAGAQIAAKYGKDHEQVKLIGGLFENALLTKQQAMTFATLPTKQVLLATFAMMIRSPLTKFASAVSSPLSSFARATQELAKKKEAQPA